MSYEEYWDALYEEYWDALYEEYWDALYGVGLPRWDKILLEADKHLDPVTLSRLARSTEPDGA